MVNKIEIEITRQAYGGCGVGFYNNKAAFIPYTVTGDICVAEIDNPDSKHYFPENYSIIKKSEDRIDPPCPNFGLCGGCAYQNINYETEIQYKIDILKYNLRVIGGLQDSDIPGINIIMSPDRTGYRSHASIKLDSGSAGFFQRATNHIVSFPAQGCLLLHPELNNTLKEIAAVAVSPEVRAAVDSGGRVCSNGCRLTEEVNEIFYERDISDFFQSNRFLRGIMLKEAAEFALEGSAKRSRFLDLACGVGFFSLYLAKNMFDSGFGIDISVSSIESAGINAGLNKIKSVEFKAGSISSIFPEQSGADLVIVDPPRTGISKKAKLGISAISPEAIVYVSCSPATFARDTRDFQKNGYALKKLTMIDMFPMTHHIEVISLFIRR